MTDVSRRQTGGTDMRSAPKLLAVAAAAAILLSGCATAASPSPSTSSPSIPPAAVATSTESASPTVESFPSAVEAAILADLPAELAKTCVRGGTTSDARQAGFTDDALPGSHGGVTCQPAVGATRLYAMAPWNALTVSGVNGDEFLGWLRVVRHIHDGSCATGHSAYEPWTGPRGSGKLACINPYQGHPWIYFSFGGDDYIGFATRDDADYGALFAWWTQLETTLP